MFLFIRKDFYVKRLEHHSNTSHVLIYPYVSSNALVITTLFKYISCSYLSFRLFKVCQLIIFIQIHLMFLFILFTFSNFGCSCSIQIHLMFLFIDIGNILYVVFRHSNTSHVLIYRYVMFAFLSCHSFKYISCSYLSWHTDDRLLQTNIQIHLMFLFICAVFPI